MEIEDEIKFTNITEVFVQDLDKIVDQFQNYQLIVILIHNCNEVQTGVSFVNDFELFVIDEIATFRFPCYDKLVDLNIEKYIYFFQNPLFLLLRHVCRVPLGQTGATVAADQEETVDHFLCFCFYYKNGIIEKYIQILQITIISKIINSISQANII